MKVIKNVMFQINSTLFMLILLLLCEGMFSANETKNIRVPKSTLINNPSIMVTDDKFTGNSNWVNGFTNISNTAKVELGIDEDMLIQHSLDFETTINFDVILTDAGLNSTTLNNQSLKVRYTKNGVYLDKSQLSWKGFYKIEVLNISLSSKDINTSASIITPDDIYLEAEISTNRVYDFQAGVTHIQSSDINKNFNAANNELTVFWPVIIGAEEYEIEYSYIDDYDISGGYKALAQLPYDFLHDATRVTCQSNYYTIPVSYNHGYLIYRVRPVGLANNMNRIEGAWSLNPSAIGTTLNTINTNAPTSIFQISNPMNENINWSITKTFDENGKQGLGVNYFDALNLNRQSIARNNTAKKNIVQSTLFDHNARPSINILPAPINALSLNYVTDLNKVIISGVSKEFNKNVFDVCIDCSGPLSFPLDSIGSTGAAKYYSNSNGFKEGFQGYTPTAKGYPYSQISYLDDITGRVRYQSIPGKMHRLGNNKEIEFMYTKPTQVELDRLFGSEAGNSTHFKKNILIDQNDQISAEYIDMFGRTVATALVGETPANLEALPNQASVVQLTDNLLTSQTGDPNSGCYEVTSSYLVTFPNEQQTFNYSANVTSFIPPECLSTMCFDCQYNMQLSIKDECGVEYYDHDNNSSTPAQALNTTFGATAPYQSNCGDIAQRQSDVSVNFSISNSGNQNVTITFPHSGTYTILKKVCVSNAPVVDYWNQYKASDICMNKLCYYIDSLVEGEDFSDCETPSCESCIEKISRYVHLSTSNLNEEETGSVINGVFYPVLSPEELDAQYSKCDKLCEDSKCLFYKEKMLLDFHPGGQLTQTSTSNIQYHFSIFNTSSFNVLNNINTQHTWNNPPGLDISHNVHPYKNPNGSVSLVNINGVTYYPEQLTIADFIANWQDSWAETLLPCHPDYCKLRLFCDRLERSEQYINHFKETQYYEDACANGYLKPYQLTSGSFGTFYAANSCNDNPDPLFSLSIPSNVITAFENKLLNFTGQGKNIYQICVESMQQMPLSSSANFGSEVCSQDQEWRYFKELYLSFRQDVLAAFYEDYVEHHCYKVLEGFVSNFPTVSGSQTSVTTDLNNNGIQIGDGSTSDSTASTQQNQQYLNNCTSMASTWMNSLSSCISNAPTPLSQSTLDNLKTDLINVCYAGSDPTHPLGSSSYPLTSTSPVHITGQPSTYVYSFQEVINYYFPPVAGVPSCDASQISLPHPYSYNGLGVNNSGTANNGSLTDCGCNKILFADWAYQNANTGGMTSAHAVFSSLYGFELLDYNLLLCACKGALSNPSTWAQNYSWTNTEKNTLYNNTSSMKVDERLACTTCVDCDNLSVKLTDLSNQYGFDQNNLTDVTDFFMDNQDVVRNTFNQYFNTNYTLHDYLNLYIDCDHYSNSSTGNDDYNAPSNTFYNNISQQAKDLQIYLNELASNKHLLKNHTMGLCYDDKYYVSDLYTTDILPVISPYKYTYAISGNNLTINIMPVSGTGAALCTINLQMVSGSGLTWANITSLNNIMAYAQTGASGGTNSFILTGTNGTSTVLINGNSTCYEIAKLTSNGKPVFCGKTIPKTNTCYSNRIKEIIELANFLNEQHIASSEIAFIKAYKKHCYESLKETFTRSYKLKEYHYTLYYYDQAGNLTRTVPPKGVEPLPITSELGATVMYPMHSSNIAVNRSFTSLYHFNSYNQPTEYDNIDGGKTFYFYDKNGRLMASQNAKQSASNKYSYTVYDQMSRIVEVGEIESQTILDETITQSGSLFTAFLANGTKSQVVQTFYDNEFTSAISSRFKNGQQNLRNRVATVTYEDLYDDNNTSYDNATHYSYDQHGNANEIIQENQKLSQFYDQQFKKIDYDFNLISGSVKQVTYQENKSDQLIHKYLYDDDNRLHEVYTSSDGINWEKDAKYFYYEHGPLARTEIGDKKVQGMDYFYTIQGWIKGVNSNILTDKADPGKDGNSSNTYSSAFTGIHQYSAKDATSYNLNYFIDGNGDYTPIKIYSANSDISPTSNVSNIAATNTNFGLTGHAPNLYNGNISSMVTTLINKDPINYKNESNGSLTGVNNAIPQIAAFKYDQLNRITEMRTYRDLNLANNEWNAATASNYTESYKMNLSYDPNGNIQTLKRNGASPNLYSPSNLNMDDLNYTYISGQINRTNKLGCVSDNPSYTGNFTNDIDDQSANYCVNYGNDVVDYNYTYDLIGNLKSDKSECISNLDWTVFGKIKRITRDKTLLISQNRTLSDLEFEYDPYGKRILKIAKPRDPATKNPLDQTNWVYTYYTYDAQGNVLAIYERRMQPTGIDFVDTYDLKEKNIYGSSRIGINKDNKPAIESVNFSATLDHGQFASVVYEPAVGNPIPDPIEPLITDNEPGSKLYELTNHLGNVTTVVSNRKLQDEYTTNVGSATLVDYYTPDIISYTDYYAFGMEMPGRTYQSPDYRYGFNGKENDPEINEGTQDFGMREYDNRLGRFFSVDPFTKLVFNKTPYCFAGNSPIAFIDKNGGFQIPPDIAKTYPELNNIAIALSNAVNRDPTINNALLKEFIVAAGLDANDPNSVDEALRVLSYGSGPVVQIDPTMGMRAFGEFNKETPDVIYISEAFTKELKEEITHTGNGIQKPVYINGANMLTMMLTLWHEGIHYEDYNFDCIEQPDRDQNVPTSKDIGDCAEEELFNCNPPTSPNNLAQRVKDGNTTIRIQNMNMSRYELSKWFHNNNIKNTLTPNRLIPGKYVNPVPTKISKGTTGGAKKTNGGGGKKPKLRTKY